MIAAKKTELMDGWVKQWQEAVDQGASCKVQDNTQVSPLDDRPVRDRPERTVQQNPNMDVCGYYFLPNAHSGDVATTIKDLQLVGVNVYRLDARRPSIAGVHRFGNFNINAVQGGPVAGADRGDDAAGRDAVHPDDRRATKHWIQASPRREPVPAVPLLLRPGDVVVPAAARVQRATASSRSNFPSGTAMTQLAAPPQAAVPATAQAVYAFNTDSMRRARDGEPAPRPGRDVARGAAAFDSGGVHFATGAALVAGTSVPLATIAADAAQVADARLRPRRVTRSPLRADAAEDRRLHGRRRRCRRTRRSTAPATGSARRPRTARRCSTLTEKREIPTSQIGQITSTDLAAGVLVSRRLHRVRSTRRSTIAAGGRRDGAAAGVRQRRRPLHRHARGRSRRALATPA